MRLKTIFDRLINLAGGKLSSKELIFVGVLLLLSFTGFLFMAKTYLAEKLLIDKVLYEGYMTEGILGSIQSLDPKSDQNQTEKDLSKLLFAGLIKKSGDLNSLKLDLASDLVATEDRLGYKVTIARDATFHDGSQITAEDVMASFAAYSELKKDFDSVQVEKIDDRAVYFKLEKPNENFPFQLDFPIFKKDFEYILQPGFAGSGPFYFESSTKDEEGNIKTINLKAFDKKYPKSPYIQNIVVKFYKSEEDLQTAWQNKEVDYLSGLRNGLLPNLANTGSEISTSSMSGVFLLFINQSKNNALQETSLRHYISQSIDRNQIASSVFGGLAESINTIVPNSPSNPITLEDLKKDGFAEKEGFLYFTEKSDKDSENKKTESKLEITISTIDTPELVATSELIKKQLISKGVNTSVKIIPKDNLEKVLKEKDFDLFLFGFYAPSPDTYYNFFHSSQTGYPKLNISGYASKRSDSLLETIKSNTQKNIQDDSISLLSQELEKDMPVIFLYKSQLAILHSKKLKMFMPLKIDNLEDRYQFVTDWYLGTEKTFRFFQDNGLIKFIETII